MIILRYKGIICGVLSIILLAGFLSEPKLLIQGAAGGMLLCAEVIIPSLFPFSVITLFLFSCGFTKHIERLLNPISRATTGLSGEGLLMVIFSFLGGFPVGAKLIDKSFSEGRISKSTAERMLCYSVNPGPAFVIIGIGQTLLNNTKIGVILFFSGILSSLTVCFALSNFEKKEEPIKTPIKDNEIKLTDTFVASVFDSSYSIVGICGFVILFSAIISIISHYSDGNLTRRLLALLEISNGVTLFPNRITFLAFLLSFSGLCIHFQILSVCKDLSVNYKKFVISRIVCGLLSAAYALTLLKVFKVDCSVIALNKELFSNLTIVSFPLSAALIFMAITLLLSVKQNFVEKQSNL